MTDLVSQLVGALEDLLIDMKIAQSNMRRAAKRDPSWEGCAEAIQPRVDAANAALSAAKDGGWQDISTAPRDGSMFLCWVSAVRYGETDEGQQYQQDVSQVDFCQWRTHADVPDGGWFDPCCGQIGDAQHVTAWQPLPTPPKEQSAGGLGLVDAVADPRSATK